jgi:hypothetical protein
MARFERSEKKKKKKWSRVHISNPYEATSSYQGLSKLGAEDRNTDVEHPWDTFSRPAAQNTLGMTNFLPLV